MPATDMKRSLSESFSPPCSGFLWNSLSYRALLLLLAATLLFASATTLLPAPSARGPAPPALSFTRAFLLSPKSASSFPDIVAPPSAFSLFLERFFSCLAFCASSACASRAARRELNSSSAGRSATTSASVNGPYSSCRPSIPISRKAFSLSTCPVVQMTTKLYSPLKGSCVTGHMYGLDTSLSSFPPLPATTRPPPPTSELGVKTTCFTLLSPLICEKL
mmetsp:Transcript_17404/g.29161  ORF Transcript_17404/g.29161 Transcript_17404/m.29161 type:complete len:220 (-) Transcript_17404:347-1006(-)